MRSELAHSPPESPPPPAEGEPAVAVFAHHGKERSDGRTPRVHVTPTRAGRGLRGPGGFVCSSGAGIEPSGQVGIGRGAGYAASAFLICARAFFTCARLCLMLLDQTSRVSG